MSSLAALEGTGTLGALLQVPRKRASTEGTTNGGRGGHGEQRLRTVCRSVREQKGQGIVVVVVTVFVLESKLREDNVLESKLRGMVVVPAGVE